MFFHQEIRDKSSGHIVCLIDHLIVHFCWCFFLESVFQGLDDFGDLYGIFLRKILRVILVCDKIDDEIVL